MFRLSRRENLIPFFVLVGVGLAVSIAIPPMFPDAVFEIPAFTLFPGEIALALILSVLFFENASPAELVRLSFTMLALAMAAGTLCNYVGQTSQSLPDATLLLNWVQLLTMNATGLASTLGLYQSTPAERERPAPVRDTTGRADGIEAAATVVSKTDLAPQAGDTSGTESAQDILGKLDVKRINSLETSLKASGNVSLESLFADEGTAQATAQAPSQAAPAPKEGSLDDLFSSMDTTEFRLGEAEPTPAPQPAAPVEAKAVEPVTKAQPAAAESGGGKLFEDVSADLDDIFSNLATSESQKDFSPQVLEKIKAEAPPSQPPAAASVSDASKGTLFEDVSADLDDIFSSLAPAEALRDVKDALPTVKGDAAAAASPAKTEAAATPTGPAPTAPAAKEVKEFGRLSAAATQKTELAVPGTLKTIGQMLLDTQAIENIIKSADKGEGAAPGLTSARVVTVSRGADIQSMLDKVAAYPGIDGSLVIGTDGLLIGATQSLGMMRDVLGVLALGIQSTTGLGTKKVDLGELRQMILKTGEKLTILTEVGIGVLAVFCDHWDLSALNGIVDHIEQTLSGSSASGVAALPTQQLSSGLLQQADTPAAPPEVKPAAPPPPPPKIEPQPKASEVAASTAAEGGLLNVTDEEIGGLFDNLMKEPEAAPPAAVAKEKPPAQEAPAGGILSVSDDDMTSLFDSLLDKGDKEAPAPSPMDFTPPEKQAAAPEPASPEPQEQPKPAEPAKAQQPKSQIKEFGRLSAGSAAAGQAGQDTGTIKAIGRQLIDVQAVENIIKAGEKREKMGAGLTTARVISAARGEGIKALLTKIDNFPGVAGSLIVGNDGLVIASTLTGGLDKDLLGALCNAMHSHSDLAGKKLQMGKLRQIIFHTHDRMTILTGVAVGVLAVFVENRDLTQVDSLLTAIESTVRG